MTKLRETWIFIVNQRGGRLLHGSAAPEGHYHFDVEDRIENTWEEHQRSRPSPLKGKDGHSYASRSHEDETMRQRFAEDLATWMEGRLKQLPDSKPVTVMSPPRMLGALRQAMSRPLARRVEQREADLGSLTMPELMQHPAIAELIRG